MTSWETHYVTYPPQFVGPVAKCHTAPSSSNFLDITKCQWHKLSSFLIRLALNLMIMSKWVNDNEWEIKFLLRNLREMQFLLFDQTYLCRLDSYTFALNLISLRHKLLMTSLQSSHHFKFHSTVAYFCDFFINIVFAKPQLSSKNGFKRPPNTFHSAPSPNTTKRYHMADVGGLSQRVPALRVVCCVMCLAAPCLPFVCQSTTVNETVLVLDQLHPDSAAASCATDSAAFGKGYRRRTAPTRR